jgi:hypothetical protein
MDASKTAYMAFLRPLYYKLLGHQFLIIHLVRNPRAVVEYNLKKSNTRLDRGVSRERLL